MFLFVRSKVLKFVAFNGTVISVTIHSLIFLSTTTVYKKLIGVKPSVFKVLYSLYLQDVKIFLGKWQVACKCHIQLEKQRFYFRKRWQCKVISTVVHTYEKLSHEPIVVVMTFNFFLYQVFLPSRGEEFTVPFLGQKTFFTHFQVFKCYYKELQ